MIAKKDWVADGSTSRFLPDIIVRTEDFARVYAYVYDINGVDGQLQTPSLPFKYPTNLYIRTNNVPTSADIITIDNWDLVNNNISFYSKPLSGTTVWIEVATTTEEFGETLTQPAVKRAEDAAIASELSASNAAISATNASTSEANALSYATSINPSVLLHTVGNGGGNPEGYTKIEADILLGNKVDKVASTDNAIVRFNGTTGQVQNSGVIIDDSNNVTGLGTINGRNISADGSKLDSIESGATADQTASEILTAIKTVDGAGSGLDADLLDGQQGSYYQPVNTAVTTSSSQALHSTDALRISGNRVYLYKGNGENEYVDIPSGLQDTAHNFATTGYQKLSNGLILQWGYVNTNSNPHTITFPITFPNNALNILSTGVYLGTGTSSIFVYSPTANNFELYTGNYSVDAYWFAIGY